VRADLPDLNQLNPEELKALIVEQHQQLASKDEQLAARNSEIEQLKLLIAKLRRMWLGRKSEKLQRQIEQLELRLEALEMKQAEKDAAQPRTTEKSKQAARPSRQPLPEHLPREVRTHLPKETACPDCGGALHKLGEEISEILERVPARFYVIRQVRVKLACGSCDKIVEGKAPSRPTEGTLRCRGNSRGTSAVRMPSRDTDPNRTDSSDSDHRRSGLRTSETLGGEGTRSVERIRCAQNSSSIVTAP
jgi:transposase